MSRCRVDSLVRVRPVIPHDKQKNSLPHSCDVIVHVNDENKSIQLIRDEFESKQFHFRCVLGDSSSQVDVYRNCKTIVNGFLNGYNGCILAYGASGTGKTYTIFGNDCERNPPFPATSGLMQMAGLDILSSLSPQDTLFISFYEIYCDEITDLLVDNVPMVQSPLHIRETKDGVVIEGLCQIAVTLNSLFPIIHRGIRSRRASTTSSNARSSRSHAIVEMTLERPRANGRLQRNVLTFGDLAGSERIKRATLIKQQLREAKAINTSIAALGHCIQLLSLGKAHIPYRDSKLTRLLASSLGGNSQTCVISTLSPCGYHYEESYSTLNFATNVERTITPISGDVSSYVLSERMKEWKWPAKIVDDIPAPNTPYVDNDCLSSSVIANDIKLDASSQTENTSTSQVTGDKVEEDDVMLVRLPNNPPADRLPSPLSSPNPSPPVADYCYVLSEADRGAADGLRSPTEDLLNGHEYIARYESIGECGSDASSVEGVLELLSNDDAIYSPREDDEMEEYSNDNNGYHVNKINIGEDGGDDSSEASEDDVFDNVYICDASSSPAAMPAVLSELQQVYSAEEYYTESGGSDDSDDRSNDDERFILQMRHLTAAEDGEVVTRQSPVPRVEYSSIRLPHLPAPPQQREAADVTVTRVALALEYLPPPPPSPTTSSPKSKKCLECQYAQEEINYLKDKVALQESEINRLRQLIEESCD